MHQRMKTLILASIVFLSTTNSPFAPALEYDAVRYLGGGMHTAPSDDPSKQINTLLLMEPDISVVFSNEDVVIILGERFTGKRPLANPPMVQINKKKIFLEKYESEAYVFHNTLDEKAFVESLLRGESIKILINNINQEQLAKELLTAPAGYIYNVAAARYGWKQYPGTESIKSAQIFHYKIGDYYRIEVDRYFLAVDQSVLYIDAHAIHQPSIDVHLRLSVPSSKKDILSKDLLLFSFRPEEGGWTIPWNGPLPGRTLLLKDAQGKLLDYWVLPKNRVGREWYQGTLWPQAKLFVNALRISSPMSTIEVAGMPMTKVMIYGFQEMWQWGIGNAGFPDMRN